MAKVSGMCAEDQERTVRSDGAVLFVAMVIPLCVCKIRRGACQGQFCTMSLKMF